MQCIDTWGKKYSKIHWNERYQKLQRVSFQTWSGSNWPGCRAIEGKSRGQGRPTLRKGEIHFWEEEKYICNWQQIHWHLAMHFYLLVKMSVTLPSPSALLSPSPSPNGNINSRRDSKEPWHVSTLFDSFCFWLTEIGNKQRPSQVLFVGTYIFVKHFCIELYVFMLFFLICISVTMEKKECRIHIAIGMQPCILLHLQQDVALHGD